MKKMSLSIFIAKVSCMIVYVTYHNMDDGAPCLFRVPTPVLGPVLDLGLLLPPPPLPPPLSLPPPVVAAGAEAAAAAIAAAAVGEIQRLQLVGAAAAAVLPALQQRQYFRPSIGSNISIYMA